MRKALALLLAIIIVAISGCVNDTNDRDTSNDSLAVEECLQKAILDNGYGRQEYYAGDLTFTVGDTLKDLADAGFKINESIYYEKIEPWGFVKTYAGYDSNASSYAKLDVYLLNECDTTQSAYNCRVICVFGEVQIGLKDVFESGITLKEEIEAEYSSVDLMPERELTYGSAYYKASNNDLAYGSSFNHIKFKFP
jgi:hypothetical protein